MDSLIKDILCLHPIALNCQAKNDIKGIEEWENYFRGFSRKELTQILNQLQEEKRQKEAFKALTPQEIAEIEADLDRF